MTTADNGWTANDMARSGRDACDRHVSRLAILLGGAANYWPLATDATNAIHLGVW